MEIVVRYRVDGGRLPRYATKGSAGCDLYAAIDEPIVLNPGEIKVVPTGLRVEVPEGYEAQVRARSGLATRGIILANGVGTIDSDYRGEIGVILANISHEPYVIRPNDRIAQLVIAQICRAIFRNVDELSSTERGEGGFGSTGR